MTEIFITGVRYEFGRITQLSVFFPKTGKVVRVSRDFIHQLIVNNICSLFTAIKINGRWKYGQKIHATKRGYISTLPNETLRDNLGSLPTF